MSSAALKVIDVQKGFDAPSWGQRNNLQAEANIAALITACRARNIPIIHIRHCSTSAQSPL